MYEHFVFYYKELVETYNCDTLVDLSTGAWLDLDLVRSISRDSGMHVVLATGYYLDKWIDGYRPESFHNDPHEAIAEEVIRELTEGMKGTDIKAGIIKTAIRDIEDEGDRKLLKAAAIAQKETGVSISTHTLTPGDRIGTLNLLEGAGVPPGRIYLGHSDTNGGVAESLELAKRGCNMIYTIWGITKAFAGFIKEPLTENFTADIVAAMIKEGYIDHVLFSVDYLVTYHKNNFSYYLYDIPDRNPLYAFTFIVPKLKETGISQTDIDRMMIDNPRKMLLRI
jgi:phosphotriesterase-related protein